MPVCLVFGDSNSYGTPPMERLWSDLRLPWDARWPNVMARTLGPEWEVIVDGLPGRTTVHDDPVEGGMRNGLTVLTSAVFAHGPMDLLILMLGANDLKHRFSVHGVEIARSVARLGRFALATGKVGQVLAIAPVPVRETGTLAANYQGAEGRQQGLEAALEQECNQWGLHFMAAGDVIAVDPIDGVHFGPAAHAALGTAVAARVHQLAP